MVVHAPDHDGFLKDLAAGRRIEMAVAIEFLDRGFTVRVGRHADAETPYEAARFTEENDLLIEERYLIEVKSSSYPFTSVHDFPFPGAYTCTVRRWEQRQQKPVAFVLVSTPTMAMLAVSRKSFPHWTVHQSHDSRRDWTTATYRCPLAYVRPFDELVEALASLPDRSTYSGNLD